MIRQLKQRTVPEITVQRILRLRFCDNLKYQQISSITEVGIWIIKNICNRITYREIYDQFMADIMAGKIKTGE